MPVEIRELVIRARVPEKSDANLQPPPIQMVQNGSDGPSEEGPDMLDEAWTQKIVDICMKQLKAWLIEKSIR